MPGSDENFLRSRARRKPYMVCGLRAVDPEFIRRKTVVTCIRYIAEHASALGVRTAVRVARVPCGHRAGVQKTI